MTDESGLFWWSDDEGHLARGVIFPSGMVVVVWDRESWPPRDRLEHPHPSIYGSVSDLLQATGGEIHWGEWP